MRKIFVILCTVLLVACGGGDDAVASIKVPLGGEMKLAVGQVGEVSTEGVTLQFKDVSEDSRCPLNALCIQAGKATIHVAVAKSGVGSQTVSLTVGTGEGYSLFADYKIRLVALDPYPVAGQPVVPGNYVATLVVSK